MEKVGLIEHHMLVAEWLNQNWTVSTVIVFFAISCRNSFKYMYPSVKHFAMPMSLVWCKKYTK